VRKSLLTITALFFFAILISNIISSCKKDIDIAGIQLLQQEIPDGFPQPVYNFEDNPLSKEGIELGRKLFYDTRLSADNQISCGSCHEQKAGFGTFEHDLSHGVFNSHTDRNAPVLFNLNWSTSFHWDGAFTSLKEEATQPILGHIEMGETFEGIKNKIKDDKEYQDLFKKVFNTSAIHPIYIVKALSQFTGSLVSANSKYDRVKKGTTTFTAQEESGYQIFKANCATCHPEPLFTDYSFRNIGLPIDHHLEDFGRMRVTGKKEDSLKFKVPTLRNTYISSNYMHDGRFGTLQQCISHYRTNVQAGPTLDPLLVNGITLTNTQSDNLLLFLRALTDSNFIQDPRLSKPQ